MRRPARSEDDGKLWITAKKKIQENFDGRIVPFNTNDLKHITLDNSGFRIRIDKHDYNSFRIDVNILETDDPLMMINTMLLALKGLAELNQIDKSLPVRCFVSFEIKSDGTSIEDISKILDRKSPASL
ncbi:Hypothetical protein Nlim_1881 [Candidatus Nitrosarchaeum limnium SFB1]|jgi:hypothetical protein|uniref:Uncharacterized protein n=1 Tax=Candidatus Nitrosarchaeum limnium SFB1 TaxID=886738 RepID=F3KNA0_9ARCH|nr:Hypothetical protein Nlim_1881 [Candidatus Nitrosarchaeum limnium SFB1]